MTGATSLEFAPPDDEYHSDRLAVLVAGQKLDAGLIAACLRERLGLAAAESLRAEEDRRRLRPAPPAWRRGRASPRRPIAGGNRATDGS